MGGRLERDGRLRPPPPTQERKKRAPQQDSPERKSRSREDQFKEKSVGHAGQVEIEETRRRSGAGKERDTLDTKHMEKEAMAKRIKELEEALKEKEEAEERKKRFLLLDKKLKTKKGDNKKAADERSSGSKKNRRLVEKFSRKFKATRESTSTSNNEGNDGDASSTSDCNTASPSPPPKAISSPDKSSPELQESEGGRAEMREKVESKANLSLEDYVKGSSGYEGKTDRLDLEKSKDEGEGEVESAEEADFGMGEKGKGSKEGASGDEGQEPLGTKEAVEDNELSLQLVEEIVQEAVI